MTTVTRRYVGWRTYLAARLMKPATVELTQRSARNLEEPVFRGGIEPQSLLLRNRAALISYMNCIPLQVLACMWE